MSPGPERDRAPDAKAVVGFRPGGSYLSWQSARAGGLADIIPITGN
jgi:hypothetical protein